MEDNEKTFFAIVGLLIVLFVCLLFPSCKTIKEVPVEKIVEKVEYIERQKIDSIYTNDSIWIKEAGDTIEIYKYKYIYKYEFIHDTINFCRVDSVPYMVEVEKQLSKYDEIKQGVGGVVIPIILIMVVAGAVYCAKKFV